jgi:hypothetical protein
MKNDESDMTLEWWWRQTYTSWCRTRQPTQPGAAPGTTIAKLAQGGPFRTDAAAREDAAKQGFHHSSVNVWAEPLEPDEPPGKPTKAEVAAAFDLLVAAGWAPSVFEEAYDAYHGTRTPRRYLDMIPEEEA